MTYTYKMIQLPPNISVDATSQTGREAADYLESVVNDMAGKGWEFLRVDSIGVQVKPGCLAALLGQGESKSLYYVITFRKEA